MLLSFVGVGCGRYGLMEDCGVSTSGLVVNPTYPYLELLLTVLFHVLAVENGC